MANYTAIGVWSCIGIAFFIYVVDPRVFFYAQVALQELLVQVELRRHRILFRLRIYFDLLSRKPGPLGRVLREAELFAIRRNPAYRELFKGNFQKQSGPLQERDD